MTSARLLRNLAGGAARRPGLVLAIAAVLGLGAAVLALRLQPTAATSSFVSSSSGTYRSTQSFYRNFGEEPVAVLVQGDLQQILLSSDLERLVGLEGCLSGKVPAAALGNEGGAGGPCGKLDRLGTVKVVFGPGTFLNEATAQIDEQLVSLNARAERQGRGSRTDDLPSSAGQRPQQRRSARARPGSAQGDDRRATARSLVSLALRVRADRPRRACRARNSSRTSSSTPPSRRERPSSASPTCSRAATRR